MCWKGASRLRRENQATRKWAAKILTPLGWMPPHQFPRQGRFPWEKVALPTLQLAKQVTSQPDHQESLKAVTCSYSEGLPPSLFPVLGTPWVMFRFFHTPPPTLHCGSRKLGACPHSTVLCVGRDRWPDVSQFECLSKVHKNRLQQGGQSSS